MASYENITLFGDRVLIQLDKSEEHTTLSSGLTIPLYENYETDGGRPGAKASDKKFLSQGTVVALSQSASKKLEENNSPLNIGDKVFVTQNAVSPQYQFFPDRSNLFIQFEGLISIPHVLIEAKINGLSESN